MLGSLRIGAAHCGYYPDTYILRYPIILMVDNYQDMRLGWITSPFWKVDTGDKPHFPPNPNPLKFYIRFDESAEILFLESYNCVELAKSAVMEKEEEILRAFSKLYPFRDALLPPSFGEGI